MDASKPDLSRYLTFLDEEPALVDPQRISENYTVVLNVFDRLVEVNEEDGNNELVPSLAESWEVSADGLSYTFHLREGVRFSNGAELTSSDVLYSFRRLLTHPESHSYDLVSAIKGADDLRQRQVDTLAGFRIVDDLSFVITLEQPVGAFLAGLSTPGASILDEETTFAAGDSFGTSAETCIGTGPFVMTSWTQGKSIVMTANENCWAGPPACEGLRMLFYSESDSLREMYAEGDIDILDLDKLGMDAEYFLRGDIYLRNLVRGKRVGISFIALNESIAPLDDVRVRKALQLGLDREMLLQVGIGGRGTLENGIFPRGLQGHNEELATIPYDPDEARRLLAEAGHADGFDLQISCSTSSSQSTRDLLELAASMWGAIGVRATVVELPEEDFVAKRNKGEIACYASILSANYNDPRALIYTFFGNEQNTFMRSLCYADSEVMRKVRDAGSIVDEDERIATYQELEKKIVQEDAAWIPLYSKLHFFVVSDRVSGFKVRWNGWSSNRYDHVAVAERG